MDRGHEAAVDADRVVQHLGDGRQAIGGAACVRDDQILGRQRVIVDAEDDGLVGAFAGGRDQHALGAGRQMRLAFLLRGEDAGAFHDDVDFGPGQIGRIADRGDLDRAATHIDRIAADRHRGRKAAMHAVIAQKVGIGLDRAQIIDGDHLDIGAARFDDGAQHVAPDATETVDGDLDCHGYLSRPDDVAPCSSLRFSRMQIPRCCELRHEATP